MKGESAAGEVTRRVVRERENGEDRREWKERRLEEGTKRRGCRKGKERMLEKRKSERGRGRREVHGDSSKGKERERRLDERGSDIEHRRKGRKRRLEGKTRT